MQLFLKRTALFHRNAVRHALRCTVRHATIAVHGGAWAIPDQLVEPSRKGVAEAAGGGYEVLRRGGSALDAVEAAVRSLELDPAFDAGRGAVLNAAGEIELDAVIMDGRNLNTGAVAALGPILHPVSVARIVMEQSEHVLLVGPGATAFALEHGIPTVAPEDLVTAAAREEWEAMAAFPNAVHELFNKELAGGGRSSGASSPSGHDTVGAIAIDDQGNLAAATSTGGITFKRVGRVGDSPIVGAGCLADNELGAISTTGHGESILRFTLASRVLHALQSNAEGASVASTVGAALQSMHSRTGGCGGAICLSPSGELGIGFSTERMAWAMQSERSGGVRCGVERERPSDRGVADDLDPASRLELVDVGHPRTEWRRQGVHERVRVITDPETGLNVRVREREKMRR